MTRRDYCLIGCLAVIGAFALVWVFVARPTMRVNADTSSAQATSTAPIPASSTPITTNLVDRDDGNRLPARISVSPPQQPFVTSELVAAGQPMDAAIRGAITAYGNQDPRVSSIAGYAANACVAPPDPHDATDPEHPDSSRMWAIQQLMDLCAGFDLGSYNLQPVKQPSAAVALLNGDTDQANRIAWEQLASANDLRSLDLAGKVLLANEQVPLDEVLGPLGSQFGRQDLDRMWRQATELATCEEMGYCGPKSIFVASYCAREGCLPSSNLIDAWQQNMSPVEYQAVIALYQWLVRLRSAPG